MTKGQTSRLRMIARARRRLVCLLVGWFVATGAPWDMLQVLAWGKMWTGHLQSASPAAALAATFSPDGFCGMCEVVQTAKRAGDQQDTPWPAGLGRVLLLPVVNATVALRPPASGAGRIPTDAMVRGIAREEPSVPPPRGTVGLG